MSKNRHKNRGGHNKIDLTDREFGKLKVIRDTGRRKSRRPIWQCACECGNQIEVLGKYLLNGDTKSCGCFSKGNAHNRTGYKKLSGSYWYVVAVQAKRRGIPLEISAKDAYEQIQNQNWKCALTGEQIKFAVNIRDCRNEQSASLDRIDNAKGYNKENIQWVHKKINIMRNTLDLSEFRAWCLKVINHTPRVEDQE